MPLTAPGVGHCADGLQWPRQWAEWLNDAMSADKWGGFNRRIPAWGVPISSGGMRTRKWFFALPVAAVGIGLLVAQLIK